jgi:bifunctional DNase/RNase
MNRMVEVELARIIINETSEQQYIWVREKAGGREFPIVISIYEAFAIDRFVKEQQMPRPLTHELLHAAIAALGAEVGRIEVTELKGGTFYANLVLVHGGKEIAVDARPSDAIALAVRSGAPLFVHEDVIDEVAAPG